MGSLAHRCWTHRCIPPELDPSSPRELHSEIEEVSSNDSKPEHRLYHHADQRQHIHRGLEGRLVRQERHGRSGSYREEHPGWHHREVLHAHLGTGLVECTE